jgi:hypothetical protein
MVPAITRIPLELLSATCRCVSFIEVLLVHIWSV